MKCIAYFAAAFLACASGFAPLPSPHANAQRAADSRRFATRRSVLESFGSVTATTATATVMGSMWMPQSALASGGATAGGAYLQSAKQRYNERVTKGVQGFRGIKSKVEGGDIDGVRDFFQMEDAGGWKDLNTAGYLLANAFRTNSATPPDSLPSVKAWKAFASNVEAMTKALKKKDTEGAKKAYQDALAALDNYMDKVKL